MGDDHDETSARVPGVRGRPEAANAPLPLGHRADLRLEQYACRTTRDHERLVANHHAMISRTTPPRPIAISPSDLTLKAGRFSSPKNVAWSDRRHFNLSEDLAHLGATGCQGRSAIDITDVSA